MKLEWTERGCPLCGSVKEARVFAESNINTKGLTEYAFASRKLPEYMHPRLVNCAECGMLYATPMLSAETLAGLYREAAFDSYEESQMTSFVYRRILQRFLGSLPDRNGAIDIGAGDGAFCERLLELGFSGVIGVEPSAAPIAAAAPEVRKLLVHRIFRSDDFSPSSVSLISCFQVMEHVPAPLEIASAALRILKANGIFLAVVHNQRALSAMLLGLKSPIYDIEHLQLFTKETGRRLLESAGFRDVQVYPLWNRYPLRYWMRLFPFPSGIKGGLISFAKYSGLGAIRTSLPAGNIVLLGFKP
jgi:SAM-dependent methyltransferase